MWYLNLFFPVEIVSHNECSWLPRFCETVLRALSKMSQSCTNNWKQNWPPAFKNFSETNKIHNYPLFISLLTFCNNFPDAISLHIFWVELLRDHKWSTVEYSIFTIKKATPHNKNSHWNVPVWSRGLTGITQIRLVGFFFISFHSSDMISSINQ